MCIYICIYVCMYVCIYIYRYIHNFRYITPDPIFYLISLETKLLETDFSLNVM